MALGPIVAAALNRDSRAPLTLEGLMEQVATSSGGAAMSRLGLAIRASGGAFRLALLVIAV
jgi:hypothetical protein